MQPFSLFVSEDATQLTITSEDGSRPVQLSAGAVDELMRRLADCRARMTPVHPAEPTGDAPIYTGDNLLWCVRPAPHASALEFGIQHPGLGWITMPLSRAQVEDLTTSIAFALQDLRPVGAKPDKD